MTEIQDKSLIFDNATKNKITHNENDMYNIDNDTIRKKENNNKFINKSNNINNINLRPSLLYDDKFYKSSSSDDEIEDMAYKSFN